MVVLTNTIDDIQNILTKIPDTEECYFIYKYLDVMIDDISKGTERNFGYEDLVHFALSNCINEIPSPFSRMYPTCYGITVGNDFFNFKNRYRFGFGVKIIPTKNNIKYEISLTFYNNKVFVEGSKYYKELIEAGWKVKER